MKEFYHLTPPREWTSSEEFSHLSQESVLEGCGRGTSRKVVRSSFRVSGEARVLRKPTCQEWSPSPLLSPGLVKCAGKTRALTFLRLARQTLQLGCFAPFAGSVVLALAATSKRFSACFSALLHCLRTSAFDFVFAFILPSS